MGYIFFLPNMNKKYVIGRVDWVHGDSLVRSSSPREHRRIIFFGSRRCLLATNLSLVAKSLLLANMNWTFRDQKSWSRMVTFSDQRLFWSQKTICDEALATNSRPTYFGREKVLATKYGTFRDQNVGHGKCFFL